jgi:cytochrome c biogenesis protein CcdA
MQTDTINIGLGFLEGFALIISPCILPVLPIFLAGSLTGSKKRPIGIIIGFIAVFSLLTFFSRKLVQVSGIDLTLVRYFSYGLLVLLGIIMLSDTLTEKFSSLTQGLTGTGSSLESINNPQGGVISGILFGGLVAIIWTPCAGPILAAVIVQTVIQKTTLTSFLILMAFGVGAATPMLLIALFGRKIMTKFNFIKSRTLMFRKILGAVIIITVCLSIYFEEGISIAHANEANTLINGISKPYPSPAISGIDGWINSPPLQINNLKGKVVLIDFWTYSCINCIRTLPYLKSWYQKYHNDGLVIIGIHTPEFEFEKNPSNIKNAVLANGIKYPVAIDSHFVTWQNFNNQYWPAHFLINKNGYVVYTHFGEGDYANTENNIRFLLNVKESIPTTPQNIDLNYFNYQTPETYFGYARAETFSSPESPSRDRKAKYSFPDRLSLNQWALQGNWTIDSDKITSNEKNTSLKINFNARKVYIVMGNTTNQPIKVNLLLNNRDISSEKGKDVVNSSINVNGYSLYEAVSFAHQQRGVLQVTSSEPGLEMYTFTFG